MSERVQAYFAKLGSLSSEDLDQSARKLAVREKQNVACLIAHIAEIGDRSYHLKLRYKNLFEYCTARLNLSEGSVYRRTQVAGVCRRFPQILEALSEGRLHLTAAGLIAPHLREDNVEHLITAAQGKTKRQIDEFLVTLAPKDAFEPSVRKQPSRKPAVSDPTVLEKSADVAAPEGAKPEGKPAPPAAVPRPRDLIEPATEERYNFRFSADKAFTEKYKRLAEVLGIENPHSHIEEVFEQALEIALEKKDPKRKLERRRKREARKQTPCPGERESRTEATQKQKAETSGSPAVSRHIPSADRERTFDRAGYQCEYRGPDGTRCTSRTGLEVEHTKPFAVYQTHDERYLRAYCSAHNLFAAREFYGPEFIQEKIEAAGREKAERRGACGVS